MKKILTLSFISVIFFVGCGQSQTVISEQNGNNEAMTEKAMDADGVLDGMILVDATAKKDSTLCDGISSEMLMQECKSATEGLLLIDKALEMNDAAICEDVKLERYKKYCIQQIDLHNKEIKDLEDREALTAQKNEETKAAIESGKLELCEALDLPFKFICQQQIVRDNAVASADPAICEKLELEEDVQFCQDLVRINQESTKE